MLVFLHGKVSERKLRMLAIACSRQMWSWLDDERSRQAVEVAESFVEGQVEEAVRSAAYSMAEAVFRQQSTFRDRGPKISAAAAAVLACSLQVSHRPYLISFCLNSTKLTGLSETGQAALLRELVGDPFRPFVADPSWLSWNGGTVVKLAQMIYSDRAFDRLPILADALEESGCRDADILAHCRQRGPHVLGCWVVDALLGKN
jgi:hypothetical protein